MTRTRRTGAPTAGALALVFALTAASAERRQCDDGSAVASIGSPVPVYDGCA